MAAYAGVFCFRGAAGDRILESLSFRVALEYLRSHRH